MPVINIGIERDLVVAGRELDGRWVLLEDTTTQRRVESAVSILHDLSFRCPTHGTNKAVRNAADTQWVCPGCERERVYGPKSSSERCDKHGFFWQMRTTDGKRWCYLCDGDETDAARALVGPAVKHLPGPVYASRSSLVAALKFSRPPHGDCSCWVCTLARVGQWHEHEAESRIDYGGECCAAMGRGLWALDSQCRAENDTVLPRSFWRAAWDVYGGRREEHRKP